MAQNTEQIPCTYSVPDDWGPALAEEAEVIAKYVADRTMERVVPVRFIQVLSPEYANNPDFNFTNYDAIVAINKLNAAFAGGGITFYQCSPVITRHVNEINLSVAGNFNEHAAFNYSSATLEVYFSPSSVPAGSASLPCPGAFLTGNPNYTVSCGSGIDNTMGFSAKYLLLDKTFIHETGHHLGLLHTYLPASPHQTPVGVSQLDRPYPVLLPSGEIHPMWWGRELVKRSQNEPGSPFTAPNASIAGDFVEDTHADCQPTLSGSSEWPGCLLSAQNSNTCEIDPNLLTYKDYNDVPIYPAPGNTDFGRNYMSYWKQNCVNSFTPGQFHRMRVFFDTYRNPKYIHTTQCGNFRDEVKYYQPLSDGQYKKLPQISIRTRHQTSNQVCNATTEPNGRFNGTLFNDPLLCDVYHNGKKNQLLYPLNDKRCHYEHEACEWLDGVDVADLIKISRHILALEPLNGYQVIAADANKSGTVTTFDIVQLRQLIMGQLNKLPSYDQPWRFVPEFVPANYPDAFNYNPFEMTIAGTQVNAALLTDATNQQALTGGAVTAFQMPDVSDQKGFDAIKIGDVDGSWVNLTEPCETVVQDPNPIRLSWCAGEEDNLKMGNEAELVVMAQQFDHISGFQLGLSVPQDYFDILDVTVPQDYSDNLNVAESLLPEYTKADHFGLEQMAIGHIKTLWLAPISETATSPEAITLPETVTLPDESVLFEIKVKAKQDIEHFTDLIKLDNNVLKAVIVQDKKESEKQPALSLCLKKTELIPRSAMGYDIVTGQKNRIKCIPNPVQSQMTLMARLSGEVENGLIQIRDVSGQVVFETKTALQKGENSVGVKLPETLSSGNYSVELLTECEKLTTRFIKL